ncbi:DUF3168 domain-containing protein [Xanthomonas oryzae]|uniref:tail completion protein gp17 n=1 Tax=Xanthomonas oryzae TaxID=347 RepID=UPI000C7CF1F6|nr:DUF3168 domain-containing protein [Xanthomonas oryzae]AUJ13420.1 hypothetical protein BVV20_16490 [Xanthomonas oryzae pv. oryzae]QBG87519.1 DUF3168 domain-containing protein [Xanthomonas oryzae]
MSLDERLVAAIGTVTQDIYPRPARNPPALYVTYQRTSGRLHATLHSGAGGERGTFQVDVWGPTKGAVRLLADQLKHALPGALKVGDITDNPDDYEQDTLLHRASFDVVVWS